MIKKICLISLFLALPVLAIPGVGLMDPQTNEEFELYVDVNGDEVTFLLDRHIQGVTINSERSYPIAAVKQEINNTDTSTAMKTDLMDMLSESFSSQQNTIQFLQMLSRILNNIR